MSAARLKAQDIKIFSDAAGAFFEQTTRKRASVRTAYLLAAGDPVVWDHLGDVYVRLGSTVEAERAWKKARDLYDRERRSQDNARGAEVVRKLERLKK